MQELEHISVCVCTYKRAHLLGPLLEALAAQETHGMFTFSALIVDNDAKRSAEAAVREFASSGKGGAMAVKYCSEPRQGIARARNKAVEEAEGDYIAFLDDDELPVAHWLRTLHEACDTYRSDGALGPVKPTYEPGTPDWIIAGKFYDRDTYPTGMVIDWRMGRTGNVLLRRGVFGMDELPFRPEFRTGEDQEFFYRVIERGLVFVWCNEAAAYETVPAVRCRRSFLLRRALLRGAMEPNTPGFGARDVIKSMIALPVYVGLLPFAQLAGHDKCMNVLVRLCDHLGKLLALAGINPVKEQYVTE